MLVHQGRDGLISDSVIDRMVLSSKKTKTQRYKIDEANENRRIEGKKVIVATEQRTHTHTHSEKRAREKER